MITLNRQQFIQTVDALAECDDATLTKLLLNAAHLLSVRHGTMMGYHETGDSSLQGGPHVSLFISRLPAVSELIKEMMGRIDASFNIYPGLE